MAKKSRKTPAPPAPNAPKPASVSAPTPNAPAAPPPPASDPQPTRIKTSVHITVTQGAAEKVSMAEAEALVKFVWPQIVKAGDHNSFSIPRLGLALVREGDELFVMTMAEKEEALGAEKS